MKKILILFVVLFSLISVERLHTVEDTEQICELLLKNVDAMASGAEIIIGPFFTQSSLISKYSSLVIVFFSFLFWCFIFTFLIC